MPLPEFSRARVLVCGDVMLDRYWQGLAQRISPEAPVPIVQVRSQTERPGGAANVAVDVAALGGHCTVIGVVGDDAASSVLSQRLHMGGVDALLIQSQTTKTTEKLRVISQNQQLLRIDFDGEAVADEVSAAALSSRFAAVLPAANIVVLSDYGKGALSGVAGLIAAARAAHKSVLIDPKGVDWRRYRGATMLTPNWREFTAMVGDCADDLALQTRGEALRADLQLDALLVTRGAQGMTLIRTARPLLHLPAMAREVFDVTGAGDTVIATLATALAAGTDLDEACRLSNLAAGIAVGKLGAAIVTASELRTALAVPEASVMAPEALTLTETLLQARDRGERIVMTNGCFDLLHRGHLQYLQAARALGDRLVVAVNDDASVRRLKGATRPVNRLDDRMAALAALRFVDHVLPFSEDTPAALIEQLAPDVLVKGGDYAPDQIAGASAVRARGGNVVVLPYLAGYSTTALLRAATDA